MKKGVDYSVCDFIERQMWFVTYFDFCDRRKGIKRLFQEMTLDAQIFYKWYVYSNVHCAEYFKDLIWSYLNFDDTEWELDLLKARCSYRVK